MKKKSYHKPLIEKVNLRVTESVLLACKLVVASADPTSGSNKACNAGSPGARCLADVGS